MCLPVLSPSVLPQPNPSCSHPDCSFLMTHHYQTFQKKFTFMLSFKEGGIAPLFSKCHGFFCIILLNYVIPPTCEVEKQKPTAGTHTMGLVSGSRNLQGSESMHNIQSSRTFYRKEIWSMKTVHFCCGTFSYFIISWAIINMSFHFPYKTINCIFINLNISEEHITPLVQNEDSIYLGSWVFIIYKTNY